MNFRKNPVGTVQVEGVQEWGLREIEKPKDSASNPARQRLKRVQNELIRTIEKLT